jgi:hypothetical protein
MNAPGQSYALIDDAIEAWSRTHSLTLFREFAGRSARFCYTSNAVGDCLQISVEPPRDGVARIHVTDVETVDDAELHLTWEAAISQLSPMLETAYDTACAWLNGRSRDG